jgi:hypothetical protein
MSNTIKKNFNLYNKKKYSILLFIYLYVVQFSIYSQNNEESNKEYLNGNKNYIDEKRDNFYKSERAGKKIEPDFIKNGREEKFLVLGASAGSPGSINLNAGYYFDRFVVRGSGMYYKPNWNGFQVDLGYSIYKTAHVIYGFSFVAGGFYVNPFDPQSAAGGQNNYTRFDFPGYQNQPTTYTDQLIRANIASTNPDLALVLDYVYRTRQEANFSQNYIGGAFDFYLDGFWVQLGMGVGKGDYRNPQLLLQVGYLFDFGRKDK